MSAGRRRPGRGQERPRQNARGQMGMHQVRPGVAAGRGGCRVHQGRQDHGHRQGGRQGNEDGRDLHRRSPQVHLRPEAGRHGTQGHDHRQKDHRQGCQNLLREIIYR